MKFLLSFLGSAYSYMYVVEDVGNVPDLQRGAEGDIKRAMDSEWSLEKVRHQPCSPFQIHSEPRSVDNPAVLFFKQGPRAYLGYVQTKKKPRWRRVP